MVRPGWFAIFLVLAATPSWASPDWRQAGGNLFVGPSDAGTAATPLPGGSRPTRVQPPTQPFDDAVSVAADQHGLDPKLLHALVTVESAYQAEAVSQAGAAGLTQLMPGTARDLGVGDRLTVPSNLRGGAEYLARQLERFGDLRLALAAYNAGPERVAQLGRMPDFTESYVQAVIECYLALSAGRSVRSTADCPALGATP
jgi:soluble lytic murein transglycosylase-like protein